MLHALFTLLVPASGWSAGTANLDDVPFLPLLGGDDSNADYVPGWLLGDDHDAEFYHPTLLSTVLPEEFVGRCEEWCPMIASKHRCGKVWHDCEEELKTHPECHKCAIDAKSKAASKAFFSSPAIIERPVPLSPISDIWKEAVRAHTADDAEDIPGQGHSGIWHLDVRSHAVESEDENVPWTVILPTFLDRVAKHYEEYSGIGWLPVVGGPACKMLAAMGHPHECMNLVVKHVDNIINAKKSGDAEMVPGALVGMGANAAIDGLSLLPDLLGLYVRSHYAVTAKASDAEVAWHPRSSSPSAIAQGIIGAGVGGLIAGGLLILDEQSKQGINSDYRVEPAPWDLPAAVLKECLKAPQLAICKHLTTADWLKAAAIQKVHGGRVALRLQGQEDRTE